MSQSRVIKRYANRKMYDTSRSCYVTLEEVADMVREGCEVQVIDNKTKNDLTEVTLTQALLDSERKKRGTVPLSGLRHLISSGGDFLARRIAEPVSRVKVDAERTVSAWKTDAERTVTAWKTEAERRAERVLQRKAAGEAGEPGSGDPGADEQLPDGAELPQDKESAAAPTLATLVEQTQKAYDEFQHKVDDRVRHAVGALGLMAGDPGEILELRKRIEVLEARLAVLEGAQAGAAALPAAAKPEA